MNFYFKNKLLTYFVKYFPFILVGLVLVTLFLGIYLLIIPKYSELKEKGGLDYQSKINLLEAREKELAQLEKLNQELSLLTTAELSQLEKVLPSGKETTNLFIQMENLARESGLEVTTISFGQESQIQTSPEAAGETTETNQPKTTTPKTGSSEINALTISLAVTGDYSYEALKIFLDNIEDNLRIVDLDSLAYSPSLTSEQTRGSFSVNLKTYYLK